MQCHVIQSKLAEYTVEALDETERYALESHLAQCQDCQRELQLLRRTGMLLNSLAMEDAPADLWTSIQNQIRAEMPPRESLLTRLLQGWRVSKFAYAGLAVMILASASLLFYLKRPVQPSESTEVNLIERHEMLSWNDPLSDKASLGLSIGHSLNKENTL